MESSNVKKLLEAYFEGNTSIREEKELQDYFNSQTVSEDLIQYQPLFAMLKDAREEGFQKTIVLPEDEPTLRKAWRYSAAAILIVGLGVGGYFLSQPRYSPEEMEALVAFEKSKNAMMLLSKNLNRGAEQLSVVKQFAITKNKIFE